jgi:thioredoxin reductase
MQSKTALVVGGGACGLVAAKELIEVGFDVTVIEKRDEIGGLWNFSSSETSVCSETYATSSKDYLQYSDFPFEEGTPDFPHHTLYMKYLHQYVAHNNIRKHIKFGHSAKYVKKADCGGWLVNITGPAGDKEQVFDRLVIATGLHQVPLYPEFPGLEKFEGITIHSSKFLPKNFEEMKGKRVVVIGAGESGADMVHGMVGHAKEVYLSMRKGQAITAQWRLERNGKVPADHEMQRAKTWLPRQFLHDYNVVARLDRSDLFCPFKTLFRLASLFVLPLIALFNPKAAMTILRDVLNPKSYLCFFQKHERNGKGDGVAMCREVNAYLQKLKEGAYDEKEVGMGWELRRIMSWHSGAHLNAQSKTKRLHWLTDIQKGHATMVPKIESIDGKDVLFADGVTRTVDALIYCTGFKTEIPALKGLLDSPLLDCRDLYKNTFHPLHGDKLAFVGLVRPDIGSLPAVGEMQGRWVAQVMSGNRTLPSTDKLFLLAAEGKACHMKNRPTVTNRVTGAVDYSKYMEELAKMVGCKPMLPKLLLQPRVLMAVMFKPMMSSQYRLHGPGAKPDAYTTALGRLSSSLLPENALIDGMMFLILKPMFSFISMLGLMDLQPVL